MVEGYPTPPVQVVFKVGRCRSEAGRMFELFQLYWCRPKKFGLKWRCYTLSASEAT